jgi:hypothetical protein
MLRYLRKENWLRRFDCGFEPDCINSQHANRINAAAEPNQMDFFFITFPYPSKIIMLGKDGIF